MHLPPRPLPLVTQTAGSSVLRDDPAMNRVSHAGGLLVIVHRAVVVAVIVLYVVALWTPVARRPGELSDSPGNVQRPLAAASSWSASRR